MGELKEALAWWLPKVGPDSAQEKEMQATVEAVRQRETVLFSHSTLQVVGEGGAGKSTTTRALANEPFLGNELPSTVRPSSFR